MPQYLLRLYITGNTPRSQRAIANLFRICHEELQDHYKVEIIDVLEQPQLAEEEKILVTPTLIKQLPPPLQRIIGDMSNVEMVLLGLDLVTKYQQDDIFKPNRVALDSLSALERVSNLKGFREFIISLTSFIKQQEIGGLFTSTTPNLMGGSSITEGHISTILYQLKPNT